MIKKASTKAPNPVRKAADSRDSFRKRLDIKQIRSFVDQLAAVPDGAPLPDWPHLSVGDRFAIALRLIPVEDRERVLGKSAAHARRYEQGTDIPLSVASALSSETEIPVDWINTGRAMPRSPALMMGLAESLTPSDAGQDVPVQKLAFKVAAGRGEMILDETADSIRFPSMIVHSLGVPPQNLRLFEAKGESMKSTINDGDWMLVDVSQGARDIVEGKIYVFAISDEAYVKRLRRAGGGVVVMISDNREMFPPEEVPKGAALRIFGRVMWAGRNL